jgi:hydrogenase maturation protease
MHITVLGLGNAVLTDDSVGLRVAKHLEDNLPSLPPGIDLKVETNEAGGWEVLNNVQGAEVLIVIDAILDDSLAPGETAWFPRKTFTSPRMTGVHNMDIFTAIDFARRHGEPMPNDIHVLGVGVDDVVTFSETCTPDVESAIPNIADDVVTRISKLADTLAKE